MFQNAKGIGLSYKIVSVVCSKKYKREVLHAAIKLKICVHNIFGQVIFSLRLIVLFKKRLLDLVML